MTNFRTNLEKVGLHSRKCPKVIPIFCSFSLPRLIKTNERTNSGPDREEGGERDFPQLFIFILLARESVCVCVFVWMRSIVWFMYKKGKLFLFGRLPSFCIYPAIKYNCCTPWPCIGKCIKGRFSFLLDFCRFKIERKVIQKYINLQCSGRACCLFAVWLSVAVLSLYNFFILFFVYINRIVSNNFYCNSLPKGQRRWLVVGKLEHTRKEPFSCAAENSSFSKLFRFIFNVLLFCSVFVILIILTCYFCVLSVSVCVGVLFVCVCFLEK